MSKGAELEIEVDDVEQRRKSDDPARKAFRIGLPISGGAIITLLITMLLSISHDAKTALDVSTQHGKDIGEIRARFDRFEVKLDAIYAKLDDGGAESFYKSDWELERKKLMEYLELQRQSSDQQLEKLDDKWKDKIRDLEKALRGG